MTHLPGTNIVWRLSACVIIAGMLLSAPALSDVIFAPEFGTPTVREMLQQGKYATVRDLVREQLDETPDDGDLHAVLAYALAGLGEWEEAEQSVMRAIELSPEAQHDDLRVLHAEILLGLGDAAEAERQLRDVLVRNPDNISAMLEMGVLYRRMGDGIRSTEYFERVLSVDPGSETALRALFETYLGRRDYDSIAQLSRRIPEDSPAMALGHYFDALAGIREDPPQYADAAKSLQRAVDIAPSPEILSTLGWVLLKEQRLKEAAHALTEAVNLAPEYFEAQRLLGVVLLQGGQPNLAAGHLEEALAIRETPELRRLLARAYLMQGRGDEFITQLLASAENTDQLGDRQSALQALHSYASNDFEESEVALREAIEQRPDAPHLRFLLISSLLKQQLYEAAIREAQQAVSAFPDEKVLALNFLGLARLGSGAHDAAESALREALAIDPDARTTRVNLSTVYFRSGQFAKAKQELDTLLDANPGDSQIRLRLARVHQAAQDYARAEQVLLNPDGTTPESNVLLRELFLLNMRADNFDGAQAYANAMVAAYPRLFEGYLLKAQAYAAQDKSGEAVDSINDGFSAAGETQGALATAASLARVNGWHDRAVNYLRRHEAQFGMDDPTLVKLYALELIETGNTDKARAVLDEGLGSTNPDALFLSARSYIADGDQVRAEEKIDAALAAGVDPAVIEQQRAALMTAVRLDELRTELEDNDGDPLRYQALAGAHEFLGDIDAAIDVYESGIGKTGEDSAFRVQVARLLYKSGATERAIDAAREILDDNSVDDETRYRAWAVIGMSHAARDEAALAERALEQATAPGSRIGDAHYRLAQIKSRKGETDEAIRLLRKAIAIEPGTLRHYLALAGAYQRANDMPKSISVYKEGLTAIPDSIPLLNDLALAQLATGDADGALTTAQQALQLAPDDARVLNAMGQVHLQQRDPRAAIPYLERAVDQDPQSSLYRFHLGISYFQAGSTDLAKSELEESLARQSDAPWASEIHKVLRAIAES